MRLKDKVAIVTGTRSGIGKSISLCFAKEGAKVVTCVRKGSEGDLTAKIIRENGGEALFIECDISNENDVVNAVEETVTRFKKIDILVNNAGVNFAKPFEKTSIADWDSVINTDLRGTYLFCRYAILKMLQNNGGSIVNITSVHTVAGYPESAPYDAAKWGVVGMTKALAAEFASRNIRVNSLAPGLIDTKIWDDIIASAEDPDECRKYWAANIPIGRPGTSDEIANAALFLASDESSYCTGSNIIIDGGMTSLLVSKPQFKYKAIELREKSDGI